MANHFIADTSAWVNHFRRKSSTKLSVYLADHQILVHPLVFGELLLGDIQRNLTAMTLLQLMPKAVEASYDEICYSIRHFKLDQKGIGWVDAALITSAKILDCGILTDDHYLDQVWRKIQH